MIIVFLSIFLGLVQDSALQIGENERIISYQGTEFLTSFDVPDEFFGEYTGRKTGYLILRKDGTGEYKYDIFGIAPPSCKRGKIEFIWGFILDKEGNIIRNERDYGFSFPFLMKSTGETSFQGCRTSVMKDFILKKGEMLHISSSDDWQKPL